MNWAVGPCLGITRNTGLNSADQVIFVLQVVLMIGPLAVYFLGLGLASSRPHPCLVSERSDFVLLALAFVPIVCWPLISLVSMGRCILAGVLLGVLAALFIMLLPRRHNGWVVYNLSPQELRRALRRACHRLGWQIEYNSSNNDESEASIEPTGLNLVFSNMPWLRNITLRCRAINTGTGTATARQQLLESLLNELQHEAMLPSPTGAGLVVIGTTLLGLPMWYFFHHIDAVVDVVRTILFA